MNNLAGYLHSELSKVCRIDGVSIGRRNDRSTWSFSPAPGATAEQIAAAQAVIDSFDATAQAAAERDGKRTRTASLASGDGEREVLLRAILKVIQGAIAQDRAYLALLAVEVRRLGGTVPSAPVTRSFAELVAATIQAIQAGAGDAKIEA